MSEQYTVDEAMKMVASIGQTFMVHDSNMVYARAGDLRALAAEVERLRAALAAEREWQPIETAPKDGTEVLAWREDCGVLLVRWTDCASLMTVREIAQSELDDDSLFTEDWFYADFIHGGRLENDEAPGCWMPLPPPPSNQTEG